MSGGCFHAENIALGAPDLKRLATQVVAIELDQVKGLQEHADVVMPCDSRRGRERPRQGQGGPIAAASFSRTPPSRPRTLTSQVFCACLRALKGWEWMIATVKMARAYRLALI